MIVTAGYTAEGYAASLSEFGTPRMLPSCGGWVLERITPDGSARDAMGCYPQFCCRNWQELPDDIEDLKKCGVVCFSAVLDPFGEHDEVLRERCFPDRLFAFKEHYVTDLAVGSIESIVSPHHRRDAQRALRQLRIELCVNPFMLLDDWWNLYQQLCSRHRINGVAAFSREAFAVQLTVPGLTAFSAWNGLELVGMSLWYRIGDVAYYHLNACSDAGYQQGASYGLMWIALEHWKNAGVRWALLGSGAGLKDGYGGLDFFKKGWSTETRTAWFGGVIFRPDIYLQLSKAKTDISFFPVYRKKWST